MQKKLFLNYCNQINHKVSVCHLRSLVEVQKTIISIIIYET